MTSMVAAGALISMTAQCRGTAPYDGKVKTMWK
jgi:hypothetical protein